MEQATASNGELLDVFPSFDDGGGPSEIDISGDEVAEALMIAVVTIVADKGTGLRFEITWQIVIFQQNAVLQCLVPALDTGLGSSRPPLSSDPVRATILSM